MVCRCNKAELVCGTKTRVSVAKSAARSLQVLADRRYKFQRFPLSSVRFVDARARTFSAGQGRGRLLPVAPAGVEGRAKGHPESQRVASYRGLCERGLLADSPKLVCATFLVDAGDSFGLGKKCLWHASHLYVLLVCLRAYFVIELALFELVVFVCDPVSRRAHFSKGIEGTGGRDLPDFPKCGNFSVADRVLSENKCFGFVLQKLLGLDLSPWC